MQFSPEEARVSFQMVDTVLKLESDPAPFRLKKLYWMLFNVHSIALANGLRQLIGNKVHAGPFKEMTLTEDAYAQYRAPVLLGSYEHELHDVFENVIAKGYDRILNIGCSVGYYAVGLALRMPNARVDAFDTDPEARRKCFNMALANGVEDRVCISGEFHGKEFGNYEEEKTLVLMDIEGAERELLDPDAFEALRHMDVIVEMHDLLIRGLSDALVKRFASSHETRVIRNQNILPDVGKILPESHYLDPFDHFLLGWEGRDGATPWGVFTANSTQQK